MRKKSLLTLLLATLFATTNLWAAFPIGDGTGLEYTWTYPDASSMTLVITYDGVGTGVMPDYNNSTNKAPWSGSTLNPKYIEIQLPDGLKNIGNYAFYDYTNEALTELTIPSSVTSIGIQAVRITHLETLVMQSADAPSLGANAISAHAVDFTIIYPCGSGESYVNNWTAFYSYLTPAEPCSEPKPAFNPSGDCGTNVHYAFNGSTGVLTISGTGAMQDYTAGTQPWYAYRDQVTSIVIEEGITTIGNQAFIDCSASVGSLPSTLTSIGSSAFSSNTALTSITIPTGVTTIGSSAFAYCSQLASVSLPSTLTSIGTYVFQNAGLTSITFPASANNLTIGNNAFQGAASLATVTFAEGSRVTSIGASAFRDITGLTEITIPASVTSIGNYAFRSCSNLATVHVERTTPPTGGMTMFRDVSSALQILVPSEAVNTYKAAAGWSTYATNIFAEGANVPANACGENLTWEYADGVLTISGTGDMSDYTSGAPAPWNNNAANITSIILPDGITSIGDYAFYGCSNASLTSITIPSSVTTIGVRAFQGWHSLTSLTIPSGVTEIGERAFNGLWAVETINVLATTPPILGELAMKTNSEADPYKINVPDASSLAYANAWALYWDNLYETTSGNHVPAPTTVGGDFGAYNNNLHWTMVPVDGTLQKLVITGSGSTGNMLERPWEDYEAMICIIDLPEDITEITMSVFNYGTTAHPTMQNVKEIYLPANPANFTWASGMNFKAGNPPTCYVPDEYLATYNDTYDNGNAINVRFASESSEPAGPNGIDWSFENNVLTITYDGIGTGNMDDYLNGTAPWYSHRLSITSVVLPDGLKSIGNYAFSGCWNLTTINMPNSITRIGESAFSSCSKLASISLPTGLTELGRQAFFLCSQLASPITIPAGITTIPMGAFNACAIPSVTFPEGLTSIGQSSFYGCDALEVITIPSTVTQIGISAFDACDNLTSVTCLPITAPTLQNGQAFSYCSDDLVITYPDGSDQDYANKFLLYWDHLRNAATSAKAPLPHMNGDFGDANLHWDLSFTGESGTLAEHEGTLRLSGTGAMDDYDWLNDEWGPWFYYQEYINHIDIASGVTKIGEAAFANMEHVNTFVIPASVTYIGGDAFFGCNNEEAIVYCYANPANLEWHDNTDIFEAEMIAPDDFLALTRTPWGNTQYLSKATKCVVPSQYLEAYKAKWARGGEYEYLDINVWFASELQDGESAEYINNALNELDGKTAPVVTLVRPLNRDGYFASLCLPFNMSASQIAESSLHSAEIKEFTNASIVGDELYIEFTPVDHIEAGKPYFVKYTDPEALGDALDRLDFMEVTIDKTAPVAVTHGGLTMTGTYVPMHVEAQTDASGVLFLGPNNQLFWPSQAGNIKPFRAYFQIAGNANNAPRRGMPARIVERDNTTTAMENVQESNAQCFKTLRNGQLIIEKNGVKYNAQGQTVR